MKEGKKEKQSFHSATAKVRSNGTQATGHPHNQSIFPVPVA